MSCYKYNQLNKKQGKWEREKNKKGMRYTENKHPKAN